MGYAFTPDVNDKYIEKFKAQTFTLGSAILKILYYNPPPPGIIFQNSPVKDKV